MPTSSPRTTAAPPRLVLATTSAAHAQRTWSTSSSLKIGRLNDLDVTLDDASVSRRHAEVVLTDEGWVVRDLDSVNGTHLNGVRLGRFERRVSCGDTLLIGLVPLRVETARSPTKAIRLGGQSVVVEAADAPGPGAGRPKLSTLVRLAATCAGATADAGPLQRLLRQAVPHFGAQRAAFFLADRAGGALELRAVVAADAKPTVPRKVSKVPATRAFRTRRSLLFREAHADEVLKDAHSVAHGLMASIICALVLAADQPLGVLHLDRGPAQPPFTEHDLEGADAVAAALAVGLAQGQRNERHDAVLIQTVTALSKAVEMRDGYTGDHVHRVSAYALLLAEELGLTPEARQSIRLAAALHDIGKIAIDDDVLRKPGRLTPAEFDVMKTHVRKGVEVVQMVPGLEWALPVVQSHHERWDGRGYPDGLRGAAIPLAARIVAIADTFDAMTSDRAYRPRKSPPEALDELRAVAGSQLDPHCVEAFLRRREEVLSLCALHSASRAEPDGPTTLSHSALRAHLTVG